MLSDIPNSKPSDGLERRKNTEKKGVSPTESSRNNIHDVLLKRYEQSQSPNSNVPYDETVDAFWKTYHGLLKQGTTRSSTYELSSHPPSDSRAPSTDDKTVTDFWKTYHGLLKQGTTHPEPQRPTTSELVKQSKAPFSSFFKHPEALPFYVKILMKELLENNIRDPENIGRGMRTNAYERYKDISQFLKAAERIWQHGILMRKEQTLPEISETIAEQLEQLWKQMKEELQRKEELKIRAAIAKLSLNSNYLPEGETRNSFVKELASLEQSFLAACDLAAEGYETDGGDGRTERNNHMKVLQDIAKIATSMVEDSEHWHQIDQSQETFRTALTSLPPNACSLAIAFSKKVIAITAHDYTTTRVSAYSKRPPQLDASTTLSETSAWFQDWLRKLTESREERLNVEIKYNKKLSDDFKIEAAKQEETTREESDHENSVEEEEEIEKKKKKKKKVAKREGEKKKKKKVVKEEKEYDHPGTNIRNRLNLLNEIDEKLAKDTASTSELTIHEKMVKINKWRDIFSRYILQTYDMQDSIALNNVTNAIFSMFDALGENQPNNKFKTMYEDIDVYRERFNKSRSTSYETEGEGIWELEGIKEEFERALWEHDLADWYDPPSIPTDEHEIFRGFSEILIHDGVVLREQSPVLINASPWQKRKEAHVRSWW